MGRLYRVGSTASPEGDLGVLVELAVFLQDRVLAGVRIEQHRQLALGRAADELDLPAEALERVERGQLGVVELALQRRRALPFGPAPFCLGGHCGIPLTLDAASLPHGIPRRLLTIGCMRLTT